MLIFGRQIQGLTLTFRFFFHKFTIFFQTIELISIIPTGNNKVYRGLYVGKLISNVINFDYQFFSQFVLALQLVEIWASYKIRASNLGNLLALILYDTRRQNILISMKDR